MDSKKVESEAKPNEEEKIEEIKEENKADSDNKNAAPPQIIDSRLMKIGDYQLHIYLEETRGLVSQSKESSSTLDPIIKLQAFDTSKHSKTKENRGSGMIYWGEHFFFTKSIEETSSFEFEKLHISVYDHNILGADSLIGEFELDLISIYFSENHSILHQWIALSNYKANFEQIQGFLKFSANCAGPEDAQVPLQDEESAPEKSKKQMFSDTALGPLAQGRVLMPPQIHTKGWQLQIKLIKGEHLIKMDDWGGSIDSYLRISFGNVEYKTEPIKDQVNPVWGLNILIPFSEPSINDHIIFKLYDWDMGKSDELVGSATFSKKEILTGKYAKLFWLNIYGSQSSGDSKVSATMNNNPALGTLWKGRILLSMEAYMQDNPKLSSKKNPERLPAEVVDAYVKNSETNQVEWMIMVEVYYGIGFPNKSTEYEIEVRWADQDILFPKTQPKGNLWEWYAREKKKCLFPYDKFEDLPDVFIYLKDGSNRICFLRQSASHFFSNFTEKPEIYFFKPELSKNPNFKFHEAGLIKLRCAIGVPDFFEGLKMAGWDKEMVQPMTKQIFMIANIYHAKNLIPADDDGSSDPYYSIEYYGIQETSPVIKDSLNPIIDILPPRKIWFKTHKMMVPYFVPEEMPPIVIRFYDKDLISDEYMGHQIIPIKQGIAEGFISIGKTELPEPAWIDLSYDQAKSGAGKVLVSFLFLENMPMNYAPSIYPPMERYSVTLRILGLRNLKSLGLFPVKRPFISFDINSLRPLEKKQSLKEKRKIETQAKETGSDPNLSTIISFDIELPKDYSLCPTLNCVVYDCILKGLKQPVLGHFSIDLDTFIKASRDRIKKKLKKYAKTLAEKNETFANLTKLIQKKDEAPQQVYSPSKDQGPKEIELSSDKDMGLKEPLLKTPATQAFENISEGNNKRFAYTALDEEKKQPLTLNIEEKPKPSVISMDGSIDSMSIVRRAQYEFSQLKKTVVEINVPDLKEYVTIGFDPKETRLNNPTPKRHYRYFVDKPLEQTIFIDKQTFDEFTILRGKRFTEDSLLSKLGGETKERSVGLFKGWVDIVSESQKDFLAKHFPKNFVNEMENNRSFESINIQGKPTTIDLNKEFMERTPVMVRIYVISAINLAQMDEDSLSDPYLVLKLGDQKLDNEKEYQTDKTNCDFNKMFEFKTILPGASQLNIQVWDKDFLIRDDLIGETFIDLENRYFSKRFRKLAYVPIETRPIFHPLSKIERGRLKLWVEIIPIRNVDEVKMIWDLSPRPPCNYELRVVVWDIEDVPSQDIEDCSDLYVTALFNEKQQKTDTHYRAQNGSGSFNWRMVWDAILPLNDPTITFQVWDKDFFSPNDFIAEATLSFKNEADQAYENENIEKIFGSKKVKVKQKSQVNGQEVEREVLVTDEKFLINLTNCKKSGYAAKETIGKLTLSLELVPKAQADASKVGLGRNEPNHSPWLSPPVGRFELSWNPLTLFNRLVGPKARRKVCICLCVTICTAMLIYLIPTIFGNLITIGIKKIF